MTPKQLLVDLLSYGSNDLTGLMLCCAVNRFVWEERGEQAHGYCCVVMYMDHIPVVSVSCPIWTKYPLTIEVSVTIADVSKQQGRQENYLFPFPSWLTKPNYHIYSVFSDHFQRVTGLNPHLLFP